MEKQDCLRLDYADMVALQAFDCNQLIYFPSNLTQLSSTALRRWSPLLIFFSEYADLRCARYGGDFSIFRCCLHSLHVEQFTWLQMFGCGAGL